MPFDPNDPEAKEFLEGLKAEFDAKLEAEVSGLKTKNAELIASNRDLKKGQEIKPEHLQAAEDRAEKAEAKLADLERQTKDLGKRAEKAEKALETEQSAARSYALDAEISSAIAAGNIVPALVPGLTAMMQRGAKCELVDGRYTALIGDKPAGDHIREFLDSEDGKAWRSAPANGGGGAPGGKKDGGAPAKTIKESEFGGLGPKERAAKMAEGFQLVPDDA